MPSCRCLLVLLFTLPGIAFAHPGHEDDAEDHPAADYEYDPPDALVPSQLLGEAGEYEADVVSAGGDLLYTWLEFTRGKGDRIWIGTRRDGEWTSRTPITGSHGVFARPTLTPTSDGRLWLSYEVEQDGQWDILAQELDDGQPTGQPVRISRFAGADIRHRAAADTSGGVWFVWQSDQDGQFDIRACRLTGNTPGDAESVSTSPRGDWHPHVAVDRRGTVHVVWDHCDGRSFNVLLRSRDASGHWQQTVPIAATPAFEGRAEVAVDHQHRVWVVWESGADNWGRPFRGINTLSLTDSHGPLHRFRQLHVAVVNGDGGVSELADPMPMPARDRAKQRTDATEGIQFTGSFYERPRVTVDPLGRLWIAYRHYYCPWLGVEHRSHVESGWGLYARCFGAGGWSQLYQFDIGQGDGLQSLELTPHDDGVCAVWTTGRTHREASTRPRGIVTAEILAGEQEASFHVATHPTRNIELAEALPIRPRPDPVRIDGTEFHLFFGDLHRHTDLSLCRVPLDGTIDDAYRYAIEVAGLDFLGITDHSRDVAMGDPLSQLWWRSRKEVTRHTLRNRFLPYFAYERSHGNTADHNVISLRPDLLRPHTYPVPEFWKELDHDTITIPHQPIRRDTWAYQDDRLRPLVEIFQGCRDASIERHVHEGLGLGYHLGFIASSDHMSTSASYACVWAQEPTRESIFRAMQARRTFGATTNIRLVVHAGDYWMGERLDTKRPVQLTLQANAPTRINTVELIIDGRIHETIDGEGRQVQLSRELTAGAGTYAYFRLKTAGGNQAWSSPIWLTAE